MTCLTMGTVGLIALAPTAGLTGCGSSCESAAPCPTNRFTIETNGACITGVTSNCTVSGPGPLDAGACGFAQVMPPTTGGTCDVQITLSDGSQASATVEFTREANNPCCPGDNWSINPPSLTLSPSADAGAD